MWLKRQSCERVKFQNGFGYYDFCTCRWNTYMYIAVLVLKIIVHVDCNSGLCVRFHSAVSRASPASLHAFLKVEFICRSSFGTVFKHLTTRTCLVYVWRHKTKLILDHWGPSSILRHKHKVTLNYGSPNLPGVKSKRKSNLHKSTSFFSVNV